MVQTSIVDRLQAFPPIFVHSKSKKLSPHYRSLLSLSFCLLFEYKIEILFKFNSSVYVYEPFSWRPEPYPLSSTPHPTNNYTCAIGMFQITSINSKVNL